MSKSKARVTRVKSDEQRRPSRELGYPDRLAQLPPKKPPAPSVRRRRQRIHRSG